MEKIVNELLKEELYYEKLENGLDVYFMPKRGFTKKYAVLATNYGSNDLEFIPIGETEPIRVNEGIAHFLEHKMFEQPDESDAFEKFSKWGANANAFTNFTTTAYLFTTTENFYDCLDHLFDYVQTPHFTDENVEKEKGIIAQEIKMYDDDPGWNVSFNAIKAMYVNHPVRVDIAGTVDSVYKITKNHLEIMNMFLFSKYDSVELFSPLLGMNAQMDLETLTHTRDQLLDKYKDDEQLIALVNRTYDYFNEILSKQFLINELEKQETKRFSFDDEQNDNVQEVHDKFNDVVLEQEQEDEILPDEQDDTFLFSKASSLDPQRMSELMDIINGDAVDEKSHEENKTNESILLLI